MPKRQRFRRPQQSTPDILEGNSLTIQKTKHAVGRGSRNKKHENDINIKFQQDNEERQTMQTKQKSKSSSKKEGLKNSTKKVPAKKRNLNLSLEETIIDVRQLGNPYVAQKRCTKKENHVDMFDEGNLDDVKERNLGVAKNGRTRRKSLNVMTEEGNKKIIKEKSLSTSRKRSLGATNLDVKMQEGNQDVAKKKSVPTRKKSVGSTKKKSIDAILENENLDNKNRNIIQKESSEENGKNTLPSTSGVKNICNNDVAGLENKQAAVQKVIKQEKPTPEKAKTNMDAVKKESEFEAIKRKILEEKKFYAAQNPDRKKEAPVKQLKKPKEFPSPIPSEEDECTCSECEHCSCSSCESGDYIGSCSEHEDNSCSCSECGDWPSDYSSEDSFEITYSSEFSD